MGPSWLLLLCVFEVLLASVYVDRVMKTPLSCRLGGGPILGLLPPPSALSLLLHRWRSIVLNWFLLQELFGFA